MTQENYYGPILGSIVVSLVVGFFLGTLIVWGRPVIKKEVTETKCDKSALEMDAEAAKNACYGTRLISLSYEDNGKGERLTPVIKCKE